MADASDRALTRPEATRASPVAAGTGGRAYAPGSPRSWSVNAVFLPESLTPMTIRELEAAGAELAETL
ncbi:hypothetical protein [Streptomyces sp. NPDC048411]|uniref:hypothetical protein n=1 Tax=Streptomyces sp. NPDC048411 TaxID=3157206 RepID=UPI00345119B7